VGIIIVDSDITDQVEIRHSASVG